jgi:hypothetical protein
MPVRTDFLRNYKVSEPVAWKTFSIHAACALMSKDGPHTRVMATNGR